MTGETLINIKYVIKKGFATTLSMAIFCKLCLICLDHYDGTKSIDFEQLLEIVLKNESKESKKLK